MSIWHAAPDLDALNQHSDATLMQTLGIRFDDYGSDWLRASMPVDQRTRQPFGLLHGGASAALAETVGSTAALLTIDTNDQLCVGLELNANHVRPMRTGTVFGTASPLHLGCSTQVWDIRIRDAHERLICVSRLTMAVIARRAATEK